MKTLSKILLLAVIVVIGTIFIAGQNLDVWVFKYRQSTIRKEIKKQIKSNVAEKDLYTFEITDIYFGKATWVKPGKEFKLNGTLYDVVRREYKNGTLYYKCINDTQESKLFAELDELVKKRMNGNTDEEKKNFTKDFLKLFFEKENISLISPITLRSSFFIAHFFPTYFSLTSPPPKKA